MSISIGEMRNYISVENPTRSVDGDGGYIDSWSATSPSPIWASIEPATARDLERIVGNTISATVSHIVKTRFHSGITTNTRLVDGTKILYVRGIQNLKMKDQWIILACEEVLT